MLAGSWLTGQVPSGFLGKGRGHRHELRDQPGILRSLVKDALFIEDPLQTSGAWSGSRLEMN